MDVGYIRWSLYIDSTNVDYTRRSLYTDSMGVDYKRWSLYTVLLDAKSLHRVGGCGHIRWIIWAASLDVKYVQWRILTDSVDVDYILSLAFFFSVHWRLRTDSTEWCGLIQWNLQIDRVNVDYFSSVCVHSGWIIGTMKSPNRVSWCEIYKVR